MNEIKTTNFMSQAATVIQDNKQGGGNWQHKLR